MYKVLKIQKFKNMLNKMLHTVSKGYKSLFGINYLLFSPTNKNLEMHTSIGPIVIITFSNNIIIISRIRSSVTW